MTNPTTPNLLKVRDLIADATARLDQDDFNARIAWCQAHNQHGVRMLPSHDDHLIEFIWGGRRLALVDRAILDEDGPLPTPDYIAETPDTVPDDWADQ